MIEENHQQEQPNREKPQPHRLYEAYRCYAEFLNELDITSPNSALLLLTSNTILLADLLLQLSPDNTFVRDITYLGLSTTLFEIAQQSNIFSFALVTLTLLALLSPVIALVNIVLASQRPNTNKDHSTKRVYEHSLVDCIVRTVIYTFPYFGLPLLVSFAAKLTQLSTTLTVFAALILILAIVNCLISEYHSFELGDHQQSQQILVAINYPYRLIEDALVIACLISVNLTGGVVSQVLGVLFTLARLLLCIYMPFYYGKNQEIHRLFLLISLFCSIGFLLAYFDQQYYFSLLLITALIVLIANTKFRERVQQWEQVRRFDSDGEGLYGICSKLWKDGLFVKGFRDLILLSRRNNTHRNQLQIQILKSKCFSIERINRGGLHVTGSEDVVQFQTYLLTFADNLLQAGELSVSILKFMQSREGKNKILGRAVQRLVQILTRNKEVISHMIQINQHSALAHFLLIKTYQQLYQDSAFMEQTEKWSGESLPNAHKELKERLFGEKTTVVFINVLEQMGKMTRISKNLPEVLGYEPCNLLGLSINEIIPFSIKPHHDSRILHFLENYSSKPLRKETSLQFYAYNQDFHLQQLNITYNWIMHDFNSLHMTGILQRVDSDTQVILTDQEGNLEGWTRKIGSEELSLDQLGIGQRKNYNIMPLFPTLIKYMDSLGVSLRTVFFKHAKPLGSEQMLHSYKLADKDSPRKLLKAFRTMMAEEQIVGACFAEIQFFKLNLCGGKAKMRQITIRSYEHIQNFTDLQQLIERGIAMSAENKTTTTQNMDAVNLDNSQKQEMSVFSEDEKTDNKIDSNFSLDPEGPHLFPLDELVFGQFATNRSFEMSAVYQHQSKKRIDKQPSASSNLIASEVSFNPTLQRNSTLFWYVLPITALFVGLSAFNIFSVTTANLQMQNECKSVIRRNQAMMIYLKSVFNPNSTYIAQFANGNLLESEDYLYHQYFNYTTFLGDVIEENKYYLFNTQLPATLQRLIRNPFNLTNSTMPIIPPTSSIYYKEITQNYLGVVDEFDKKFTDTLALWSQTVDSIRYNFFIRLVFLCLAAVTYILLLVWLHIRQRKHNETLEAFFKFQKQDLQRKITGIGALVREVEAQMFEWHLLKEFSEMVKRKEISNIEFALIKNPQEVKIKFDRSQETEEALEQKDYYATLLAIVLFTIAIVIFLALHTTINLNALNYYQTSPSDLDNAAKLIIQPNYFLADLFLPMPDKIRANYEADVNQVLTFPLNSMPQLYALLSNAPCPSCNYMYPVLTTNYNSFYSTFKQRIAELRNSNNTDAATVSDLFFAADTVINNLFSILYIKNYNYVEVSLIAYAAAMTVVCLAIHLNSKKINQQIEKLELFLKFFSEETIVKNKHMNRLFSNNQ